MERLRDGEATDFERFLLDSADEAPAPELRDRVLAGLGVAAAVGTVASAAHSVSAGAEGTAGTGAAGGSTAAAAQATSAAALKALLVKVVLAVIAVVATTAVVVIVLRSASEAPVTPPVVVTPAPVIVPEEPAARPSPSVEPPAVAAPPVVRAPKARVTAPAIAPSASAAVPPGTPKPSTVASEVAALDRARSALSAGNAKAALAELARYDAEFPGGTLRQEKTVLEVRALIAAGRKREARDRVDAFLGAHPKSAQAARLRSLVE